MQKEIFQQHINALQDRYTSALEQSAQPQQAFDAVLIASGSEQHYFGDDRGIPFQAYGHFCQWLPLNRPDQFLLIRPGHKPRWLQVVPKDFWHDQSLPLADWWAEAFDIVQLHSVSELPPLLNEYRLLAWLGEPGAVSQALELPATAINPAPLLAYLDYYRALKSEYEVQQLRHAAAVALRGHDVARDCFLQGGSEFQIHMAYLEACQSLEDQTPYTNIVALDEKSAILHYQYKRTDGGGQVLLIDAGARSNNYCSDITRTYTGPEAPALFKSLLAGMEALELKLVDQIEPGKPYPELHEAALQGVGNLLLETEICRGSIDTLMEQRVPHLFMPHGVGHLLGVQVHDVGGHQADEFGAQAPPPAHSPALRNTRILGEDMVITIEPGCYFIPMLLEPERDSERGRLLNWSAIEQLYSSGGIRIEDDVRVTAGAAENLTRP